MSKASRERAIEDANRNLGKHVIREEPVRSFRFFCPYVNKKVEKGRVDHRPGFVTFLPPIDKGSFSYSSTYCFTLTWTPGHMTILGDIGELVVVHYHAMPTLEEACKWLQSSDFNYLLSKTNVQRQYNRDGTWEEFRRGLNEEVLEHLLGRWDWRRSKRSHGDRDELRAWRRQKPVDGRLNEEGEDEVQWRAARPFTAFDDTDRDCWARWHNLRKAVSIYEEQYDVAKSEDRHAMLDEVLDHFDTEESATNFLYGDLGGDDPYIAREYPHQAFFQIAAIQHGCRMILDRISRETAVAA